MGSVIPQRDLRNRNAQVIDRVVAGESFVVTRDGVPVADVTPHVAGGKPPRFPRVADLPPQSPMPGASARRWLADLHDQGIDATPRDP